MLRRGRHRVFEKRINTIAMLGWHFNCDIKVVSDAEMQTELVKLETEWLHALEAAESKTPDGLLDPSFVSSQWNAPDELLLRDGYLREADRAQFRGWEQIPVFVEIIENSPL